MNNLEYFILSVELLQNVENKYILTSLNLMFQYSKKKNKEMASYLTLQWSSLYEK